MEHPFEDAYKWRKRLTFKIVTNIKYDEKASLCSVDILSGSYNTFYSGDGY